MYEFMALGFYHLMNENYPMASGPEISMMKMGQVQPTNWVNFRASGGFNDQNVVAVTSVTNKPGSLCCVICELTDDK